MADREEGFSLIELMVVVSIVAIVSAVLMPTFVGAIERSHNRSAQAGLRKAMTAALAMTTDSDGWFKTGASCQTAPITAASLSSSEPGMAFTDAAPDEAGPTEVAVEASDDCRHLRLVRKAGDGRFIGLDLDRDGAAGYCWGDAEDVAPGLPCTAREWR
jgi:prepilin-type N-terminal cleavage/methylation domain-containing protein